MKIVLLIKFVHAGINYTNCPFQFAIVWTVLTSNLDSKYVFKQQCVDS